MKKKIDTKQLSEYKIFENIEQKSLESLAEKMKIKSYKNKQTIIKEGEEGKTILFLISGDISISQALTLKTNEFEHLDNREKELIRINSNEQKFSFGEISLFNNNKERTATVKTNSECVIGEINFKDLFEVCEANNLTGYQVMKNIGHIITKQLIVSNRNVLKLTTAFSLMVDK